jgi:hypothetical protein
MAVFFVVENSGEAGGSAPIPREFKSAKTLEAPKLAKWVKMEAGSVAEAQEAWANMFPGNSTGTPVVVAEAAWKTS